MYEFVSALFSFLSTNIASHYILLFLLSTFSNVIQTECILLTLSLIIIGYIEIDVPVLHSYCYYYFLARDYSSL